MAGFIGLGWQKSTGNSMPCITFNHTLGNADSVTKPGRLIEFTGFDFSNRFPR
jgi:hypothetical protein